MSDGKPAAAITSEDQLLEVLDSFFPRAHPALLLGRGDDCAEFRSGSPLALSTDLFLEDVHFRRGYFNPSEIGRKALAVNLSDLAAAGARPLGFSLGLMCPPDLEPGWMRELFGGMSALAAEFDLPLAGGDISASAKLGFSITVWGGAWPGGAATDPSGDFCADGAQTPFLRRGAEAGDALFLLFALDGSAAGPGCGPGAGQNRAGAPVPLGLPRLGLELLEKQGRSALENYPAACAALLCPRPLLKAGKALALADSALRAGERSKEAGGRIRAMDLSDGLRRDLPRLLNGRERNRRAFCPAGSTLGAELDFDPARLHPELLRYFGVREQTIPEAVPAVTAEAGPGPIPEGALRAALSAALTGGEEYALLCACPLRHFELVAEAVDAFAPGSGLLLLGRAAATPGIRWRGADINDILPGDAFDHFGA